MTVRASLVALVMGAVAGGLALPVTSPHPAAVAVAAAPTVGQTVAAVVSTRTPLAQVLPPRRHAVALEPIGERSARPGTREVVLTFDDGPDPRWTPAVLALLRRHHVHAVFCMIGSQAQARPDLVRAVAEQGHELCNHTQTHDLHLARRPLPQVRAEIKTARAVIDRSAGRSAQWYRAPGGSFSTATDRVAQSLGLAPLAWTDDPRDWDRRPASTVIVGRVLAGLAPGRIVLLHDGGGDRSQTVAALQVLLTRLPELGYRFVLPDSAP